MRLTRQPFVEARLKTAGRLMAASVQTKEVFCLEQTLDVLRQCGIHPHVVFESVTSGHVDRAVDILT